MPTSYVTGMVKWLNRSSYNYFSLTCGDKDIPICRRMLALILKNRRVSASKQVTTARELRILPSSLRVVLELMELQKGKQANFCFSLEDLSYQCMLGHVLRGRDMCTVSQMRERIHRCTMCPGRCRGGQAKAQSGLSLRPLHSWAAIRDFNLLNHTQS